MQAGERQNLVNAIQDYISDHYEQKDWILADTEAYQYFKNRALQTTGKSSQILKIEPKVTPESPPKSSVVNVEPYAAKVPTKSTINTTAPKSASQQIAEKLPQQETARIALIPMPQVTPLDVSDFQKVLTDFAPSLKVLAPLSEDRKEIALVLIVSKNTGPGMRFLRAVADAVSASFGPCQIKEGVVKTSSTKQLAIPDPELYLREPIRKAELWTEIKHLLHS